MNQKTRERIKTRSNFLPTALITLLLWFLLGSLIYFFSPQDELTVPLFFLLAFLTTFLTFALLLGNTRRGLLTAIGIIAFLLLRLAGQGHLLNAVILAGLLLSIEVLLKR